jgi:hypothetical protein
MLGLGAGGFLLGGAIDGAFGFGSCRVNGFGGVGGQASGLRPAPGLKLRQRRLKLFEARALCPELGTRASPAFSKVASASAVLRRSMFSDIVLEVRALLAQYFEAGFGVGDFGGGVEPRVEPRLLLGLRFARGACFRGESGLRDASKSVSRDARTGFVATFAACTKGSVAVISRSAASAMAFASLGRLTAP